MPSTADGAPLLMLSTNGLERPHSTDEPLELFSQCPGFKSQIGTKA